MKRFATSLLLIGAGLLLVFIGASVLFAPQGFFAGNGITLSDDANLLSEIRAPGGMLLISGVIMMIGARVQKMTWSALSLATMIYGTYGLSRAVSLGMDGMPSNGIATAMVIELVVATLALLALSACSFASCDREENKRWDSSAPIRNR